MQQQVVRYMSTQGVSIATGDAERLARDGNHVTIEVGSISRSRSSRLS